MNREIKYRGKDSFYEWVYGSLVSEVENDNGKFMVAFIAPSIPCASNGGDMWTAKMKRVKPETIGQFTGLLDKNGKEIYEGDVIKMSTATYGDEIFRIGYEDSHIGAFCLCSADEEDTSRFVSIFGRNFGYEPFYCEVIGNIHDNPELLKGGDNE